MDITIDSFPIVNPVNMALYVASYYIDVDFDGKRDFLAIPNEGAEASGKNFEQILTKKLIYGYKQSFKYIPHTIQNSFKICIVLQWQFLQL